MENSFLGSSSDDDDTYINAAARYQALKNKPIKYDVQENEDEVSNCFDIAYKDRKVRKENTKKEKLDTSSATLNKRVLRNRNKNRDKFEPSNSEGGIISLLDDDIVEDELVPVMQISDLSDCVLIDSDTENSTATDNYTMMVKVLWRSKDLVRLDIRRYESFRKVFEHFAALENVPVEQILILKKDKQINHSDTPDSIGLSVIDILDAGVINAEIVKQNEYSNGIINENVCKIKVQTGDIKKSIYVNLKRDETFNAVIDACVEQLNIPQACVKLYFDGDLIDPSDTPESLDLEYEACIDLRIKKS